MASLGPNSGLLGGSLEEAALVDQWIHLAESEVDIYVNFIRGLCAGRFPYNKPVRSIIFLMKTVLTLIFEKKKDTCQSN